MRVPVQFNPNGPFACKLIAGWAQAYFSNPPIKWDGLSLIQAHHYIVKTEPNLPVEAGSTQISAQDNSLAKTLTWYKLRVLYGFY